MSNKPGIPQGTRDFNAAILRRRYYIFNTIRSVFELYGFEPLETPAMENLQTLTGKYGEEGDRLIFKILNNGLQEPAKAQKTKAGFEAIMDGKSSYDITERALRYDLTVPFARFVAMNHHNLPMPYKRYQIQPVWRADRPQKSRYREFYQCDADVVGSASLQFEVELAQIYHTVFSKLGIRDYSLKINSRKILAALAEACRAQDKIIPITVAIDKLDKIGLEGVKTELQNRGLIQEQIELIESYLNVSGTNQERLAQIRNIVGNTYMGQKGIEEISFVTDACSNNPINLEVDFTLARGLNYYTGIIFEVKAPKSISIGSIGGGGRYDDLTGLFGVPNLPGVGISFGVDRIYDVMDEMQLFNNLDQSPVKAVFFNMGAAESRFAFNQVTLLRNQGIACELYPEAAKMDKQFKYAEKKQIGLAIIIGSREMETNTCVVKNLVSGEQQQVAIGELENFLRKTSL